MEYTFAVVYNGQVVSEFKVWAEDLIEAQTIAAKQALYPTRGFKVAEVKVLQLS